MDAVFAPPAHAEVLQLMLQIALLLGLARLMGEWARRLGQPAVAGEILAGVVLGPSVLGSLVPGLAASWLPASASQSGLLETVALLGAILLLVVTGFETDLGLIRRRARTAAGVALGGLALPFAAGLSIGWWFPSDLMGDPTRPAVFALFVATALAVSAIPVLAAILHEMGLMRRDVGQTMLAAGMVDDLAGWTVLGVVIALAEGEGGMGTVAATMLTVALFVMLTALAGPYLVNRTVRIVHRQPGSEHRFLTLALVLVFGWATLSQALHLEPVIGAFAMGILLGRSRRLPASVGASLESMAFGVFAPVFFAVTGLKVDIGALTEPRLAFLTVGVIVVAVVTKVAGAYAGARWLAGADHWTGLAYGSGLAARGAIGIVVATIGLSLGILTPEVFSMVVTMAVVTSLATPPALAACLRRVAPETGETARLRRETVIGDALTGRVRRVLVPVRPRRVTGDGLEVKVALLDRLIGGLGLAVTVMSVASGDERREAESVVRAAARLLVPVNDVTSRVVPGDPVLAVLDEAAKGYDLLVVGATEFTPTPDELFGGVVDDLVRMAPIPTLVVRGVSVPEGWRPRSVLVPTDGSRASRRAADLAFAIAGADGMVTALHVVAPDPGPPLSVSDTGPVRRLDLAHQIVGDLRDRGEALGVPTTMMVEVAPDPGQAIVEAARRLDPDLVVLGTSARTGTRRLFLGPGVERVLSTCPVPVAVLNS